MSLSYRSHPGAHGASHRNEQRQERNAFGHQVLPGQPGEAIHSNNNLAEKSAAIHSPEAT